MKFYKMNSVGWYNLCIFINLLSIKKNKNDSFEKPLMITEMGSLTVGGKRNVWFSNAFTNLPKEYPDMKAVLFFDDNSDNTTLNKSLDWSIAEDTLTCNAIHAAIDSTWNTNREKR